MRLSGCVLVKDEQRTLGRCLHSLSNLVDELVVVDTGSTDGSVQIAKDAGAQVFHYEWNDNFARARNFALDKLTGDWVVFLDADEYTDIDSSWLRQTLSDEPSDGLLCSLVNLAHDCETVYNVSQVIRVFRLQPAIRYVRRIHEYLVNGTAPISHSNKCAHMNVYHLGYSPEAVGAKDKYLRNRKLLLRELREDRKNSDLHYYLAETYLLQHELHRAVTCFQRAVRLDRFVHVHRYWAWARQMLVMIKAGSYESTPILSMLDDMLARRPKSPELWAYRGMVLAQDGEATQSLRCLEKSVTLHCESVHRHHLFADIEHEVVGLIGMLRPALSGPAFIQGR